MKKENNRILLSVLTPTLDSRVDFFKKITNELNRQISELPNKGEIEVLSYLDNRQKTTGFKRNALLKKSKGLFIVFVDDDDKIHKEYLFEILKAIKNNPDIDAIGIQGLYSEDRVNYSPFETSLKHDWETKDGWHLRTINHISPIRREHAIKVEFPNLGYKEDFIWTMELKKTGLLKKEVVIKKPMYIYEFVADKEERMKSLTEISNEKEKHNKKKTNQKITEESLVKQYNRNREHCDQITNISQISHT